MTAALTGGTELAAAAATTRRRGLGLWFAASLAIVYCMLAVGIGLDRASVDRPGLVEWVPDPLRQRGTYNEIRRLVEAGEAGRAVALARQLVDRDPIGAASAASLGLALAADRQNDQATAAFRVSAKLGWREPMTQLYWLQYAIQRGDFDRAVQHFGAMAQQWPDQPLVARAADQLEQDLRGQAAMARSIAAGASWTANYVATQPSLSGDQLMGRAAVLLAAAQSGERLGCDEIGQLVSSLADSRPGLAARLWLAHCQRAAPQGSLADGGFEQLGQLASPSPFDWALPGDGALESRAKTTGRDGQALFLRSTSPATLAVASQRVALSAGTYRIGWTSDAATAATANRLMASLSCRRERAQAKPTVGQWRAPRHELIVHFSGECEAPWLQFWLKPGSAAIEIDNVVLKSA
jgi:hypothetical protein